MRVISLVCINKLLLLLFVVVVTIVRIDEVDEDDDQYTGLFESTKSMRVACLVYIIIIITFKANRRSR